MRENPIWVMGLGAPHGLNGLFSIFAEEGSMAVKGLSHTHLQPRPLSGGTAKGKLPKNSVQSVRLPRSRCPAKGSGERTHRASPSALRAGPEPAPMRSPTGPRTRAPRPLSARLGCDRPGPITAPIGSPRRRRSGVESGPGPSFIQHLMDIQ